MVGKSIFLRLSRVQSAFDGGEDAVVCILKFWSGLRMIGYL